MSGRRRRAVVAGLIVIGLAAGIGVAGVVLDAPRPRGVRSSRAEAMAARMERAVDVEAFERLGAIAFTFGRDHAYVWDRRRHFVDVALGDVHVQMPLDGGRSLVRKAGREITREDETQAFRDRAMRAFVNDVFWLNPIAKLRDTGVVLEEAEHAGRRGLLVTYTSGGFTPGDAYFWTAADDGTPERWWMWVSVLPIGGISTTWEGWRTLPGGARVATRHASGPFAITLLHDVRGAPSLDELVDGPDPFETLVALNTSSR